MYQIDNQSRKPVYEQIQEQVENHILLGVLKNGDQLSSVRGLSLQLHLNPNTVQRAYQELERKGEIYSITGVGSFVSEDALDILRSAKRSSLGELKAQIKELALSGVKKSEIIMLIENVYNEEAEK